MAPVCGSRVDPRGDGILVVVVAVAAEADDVFALDEALAIEGGGLADAAIGKLRGAALRASVAPRGRGLRRAPPGATRTCRDPDQHPHQPARPAARGWITDTGASRLPSSG